MDERLVLHNCSYVLWYRVLGGQGQNLHTMNVVDMRMIRWMCGYNKMNVINENIRQQVEAPIEEKLNDGWHSWLGHVLCIIKAALAHKSDVEVFGHVL